MAKWEFLFGSDRVEVEGTTWLDALGKALGSAGFDSSVLTRLHLDVQPGDRVAISDTAGNKMFLQPVLASGGTQADADLFCIPPDLAAEDAPEGAEPSPATRRGPPPRATDWRAEPRPLAGHPPVPTPAARLVSPPRPSAVLASPAPPLSAGPVPPRLAALAPAAVQPGPVPRAAPAFAPPVLAETPGHSAPSRPRPAFRPAPPPIPVQGPAPPSIGAPVGPSTPPMLTTPPAGASAPAQPRVEAVAESIPAALLDAPVPPTLPWREVGDRRPATPFLEPLPPPVAAPGPKTGGEGEAIPEGADLPGLDASPGPSAPPVAGPAAPEPPPALVIPPAPPSPPVVTPAAPEPPPALVVPPAPPSPPVVAPAAPAEVDELPPGFGEGDEAIADFDAFLGEKPVRPSDLDEWLFDKSMDINEAMDIPDAARTSLQILVDLVGAESGCVLYGDYNCTALEFIAAAGPTAHKLRGVRVEIESSLAGFCHRMGFGLLVADTSKDARFDQSVDARTGYRTRAILAVPLRTTDGWTYGCIELLNAPWGFEEWMMDATQNIATTLAGFIHVRL